MGRFDEIRASSNLPTRFVLATNFMDLLNFFSNEWELQTIKSTTKKDAVYICNTKNPSCINFDTDLPFLLTGAVV